MDDVKFGDGGVEIGSLTLEMDDLCGDLLSPETDREIRTLDFRDCAGTVLRPGRDQFLYLGQGEAETLAFEDELQADAISCSVIAYRTLPAGCMRPLSS